VGASRPAREAVPPGVRVEAWGLAFIISVRKREGVTLFFAPKEARS
jgi:hypothetical protein